MRKLILILVLAALPGAAAPLFQFTLTSGSLIAAPGTTATFGYNLVNASTAGEALGFSNLAFSANFTGFGTKTDLIDPLLFLPAGTSATGNLFSIALLPGLMPGASLDGTVFVTVQFDDADFTVDTIAQRFAVTAAGTAIPEPSTVTLLGTALSAFAVVVRKRKRQRAHGTRC